MKCEVIKIVLNVHDVGQAFNRAKDEAFNGRRYNQPMQLELIKTMMDVRVWDSNDGIDTCFVFSFQVKELG